MDYFSLLCNNTYHGTKLCLRIHSYSDMINWIYWEHYLCRSAWVIFIVLHTLNTTLFWGNHNGNRPNAIYWS